MSKIGENVKIPETKVPGGMFYLTELMFSLIKTASHISIFMNSKTIKSLIGALSFGLLFAVSVFAQTEPPAATVVDGGLDLDGDGTADIATPTGTVTAEGDLDLDGDGTADVTKPTAAVLPDGSLDTDGDGQADILVPDLPGGNAFIDFANVGTHSTVQFDDQLPITDAQLHWSYALKTFYQDPELFADGAYFYELGAWVHFFKESGTQSLDGVWGYAFNFPAGSPIGSGGTFVWFNLSGYPTINGPADIIDGWLYLFGSTSGWYKLKEFPDAAEPGTYLFAGDEAWNVNPG